MRARGFLFGFLIAAIPAGLFSEEGFPSLTDPHSYIKLIAQEAALPALQGEEKYVLRESWWSGNLDPGKA